MAKITKALKKIWVNSKKFTQSHPLEAKLLVVVLLVAAFVRFYKIGGYATFLGDEGRDAIVVRNLLVHFDPILIGPGTSIGNMYLGPLYYYFMAPALLLANFSPVGPAVLIALLGVITVWFVWYVTRLWFSGSGVSWGALAAALMYALSPTAIIYSRSSWNPNIMPFFALLALFAIWKVWYKREFVWLTPAAISLAFTLQSHYLALLLVVVCGIFWFITFAKARQDVKTSLKSFFRNTLKAEVWFVFLMSPLVIFDARHGWHNFAAIKKFFFERQTTLSAKPWTALPKLWPTWVKVVNSLFLREENLVLAAYVAGLIVLCVVWLVARNYKSIRSQNKSGSALTLLLVWLAISLIGLGVYKQEIYAHYYGFFQVVPFILLGATLTDVLTKKIDPRLQTLFFAGLFMLPFIELSASPLKYPPAQQITRARLVATQIEQESGGARFNLAVIAERNYEDGYQYFLEKDDAAVADIDAQRADETITQQLFVVCELPVEKCDPTHSDKAEVASFGWSKVVGEWEVYGVRVYKLEHADEL